MTNPYYNPSGAPVSASRGLSSAMRDEFSSVGAAFALLPTPTDLAGGTANLGVAGGVANAYTATINSQVAALYAGLTVRFIAPAANTGASTLNVNALGAKAIVRPTGAALAAGDILSGQVVELSYSAANDNWQLAISATGASPASFSGVAAGTINLLTGASIPSAATVNLNAGTGNLLHITGTTTITAITLTRGPMCVVFDGILTLTHHATNNNLPGAANITTAAGDRAWYWSDGTTVYCILYVRGAGLGPNPPQVVHVRDEKSSGTAAGNSSTGSFITRTLNTVVTNEVTGASLASNQVTLPAGTYEFECWTPLGGSTAVNAMMQLFNVTDAAAVVNGVSSTAGTNAGTFANVQGKFTITGTKVFEVRQRFSGVAPMATAVTLSVNEVYTSAYFRKVA